MTHIPVPELIRYADGDRDMPDVLVWAIEVHLETCRPCREHLGTSLDPHAAGLVERVRLDLTRSATAVTRDDRPISARRRWSTWALMPRLAVTIGALLGVLALDLMSPRYPSLVLLVSPIAPLFGVAAAWSRRNDPAWEILAATPHAGLGLLLRRTLTVLVLLAPVLVLAGWAAGDSPVLWLLPCLCAVAGTLALGSRLGISRAAGVVAGAWAAGIALPALFSGHVPGLLGPAGMPGWAVVAVALSVVVWVRAADFRGLASRR